MFKKTAALTACLIILVIIFTGAVKKNVSSVKKSEITFLKDRLAALEAQKVSLSAKNSFLEKEITVLKKENKIFKTGFFISTGASALLLLVVFYLFAGKRTPRSKKTEDPENIIKSHFDDIFYKVLDDWQNIWFHPENTDSDLYEDIKNHWPDLYEDIEKWKKLMKERETLSLRLNNDLAEDFPGIETTSCTCLLATGEPFIDADKIKVMPYTCARQKDGSEKREELEAFISRAVELFSAPPYDIMRQINNDISTLKQSIDFTIRKLKFTREFPGECRYSSLKNNMKNGGNK